jgi:hypothetical protein
MEHPEEPDASMGALQRFVAALAEDAAKVLRDHPFAEIVGIIAESGTIECKRARTLIEQGTGKEHGSEDFAGILPTSVLPQILDQTFPPEAIKWIMEHDRNKDLQIIVCTKAAVRVASVALPEAPGAVPPES